MEKKILYLDDEISNLEVFEGSFCDEYDIYLAQNKTEALEILNTNNIRVLISDYRMPDISGIDFIKEINEKFPEIVCFLVTAYTDIDILITAINTINIDRFVQKPWKYELLKYNFEKAFEKVQLLEERTKLITELTIAKQKAEESDRMKSAFLSSISHEIRTPLNGIMGFTNLIASRKENNQSFDRYRQIIIDSSNRLMQVVDDILTASKIATKMLPVSKSRFLLMGLLYKLYEKHHSQAVKKGLSIDIKRPNKILDIEIETDREKLFEIFQQLLNNAVKFTAHGEVEFGFSINGTEYTFFIKDTGCGIPIEFQQVMYDFFSQGEKDINTKLYDGNGLGLAIVKGLIDLLNGKIWLKSKMKEGTTFYFSIPIIQNKIIKKQQSKNKIYQ